MLVAVIVRRAVRHLGPARARRRPLQHQPGLLVIDKQTGSSYVFCQSGKLCPVLNYASARLALQSTSVNQQTVSQASLAKFARGPLIGIPGLPQPLPDASLLVRQPWSVCTQTARRAVRPADHHRPGRRASPTGGRPLGGGALLTQALGQDWVIWNGQRMPIQPGTLADAVRHPGTPVPVPPVWLNALPQGPRSRRRRSRTRARR